MTHDFDRRTFLKLAATAPLVTWGDGRSQRSASGSDNSTRNSDDWTHRRYGPRNRGYNPDAIGPSTQVSERWSSEYLGTPVIKDGQIFVSGIRTAQGYGVRSLDLTTGRELWQSETGALGPLCAGQKRILVVDLDENRYKAFSQSTGDLLWSHDPIFGSGTHRHNPMTADGVYVVQEGSGVAGIDAESGDILWKKTGASRVGIADGKVFTYTYETYGNQAVSVLDVRSGTEGDGPTLPDKIDGTDWRVRERYQEEFPLFTFTDGKMITPVTDGDGYHLGVAVFDRETGEVVSVYRSSVGVSNLVADESTAYFETAKGLVALTLNDGTTRWTLTNEEVERIPEGTSETLVLSDDALYLSRGNGEKSVLAALAPDDGSIRWTVPKPITNMLMVTDEFLTARTGGITAYSGPPLTAVLPDTVEMVAGKTYDVEVELGNSSPDPITGIDMSFAAGDVVADYEIQGVPDTLGPDERATVTLTIRAKELVEQTTAARLVFEADGLGETERSLELDIRTPVDLSMVSSATADRAFAEQEAKFTFDVTANEFEIVEEVGLYPRFDRMDGEWFVNNPQRDPDAIRHDGGDWSPTAVPEFASGDFWLKPAMAPGETQQPSLKMAVPDLPPGVYTLPVEAYIHSNRDDGPIAAATLEFDLTVEDHYVFVSLDPPRSEQGGGETVDVGLTFDVLDATVTDPTVEAGRLPDEFTVSGGSAEGGSYSGGAVPTWEWKGQYTSDDTLTGTLKVQMPDGPGAGGVYTLGIQGEASVPEVGESRTYADEGRLHVSGLPGKIAKKRTKASRIDDITRFTAGEFDLVSSTLDTLETRANDDAQAPTLDQAERAVERMWLGEEMTERMLEVSSSAEPETPPAYRRTYNIVRPTAEASMSMAGSFLLAASGAISSIIEVAASSPPLSWILKHVNGWAITFLQKSIDDLVRWHDEAEGAAEQFPLLNGTIVDGIEEQLVTRATVTPSVVDELLTDVIGGLTDGLVNYLRGTMERKARLDLEELTTSLSADGIGSSGLAGSQTTARNALGQGVDGLESRAMTATRGVEEFNDGILSLVQNLNETTAKVFSDLTSNASGSANVDVWTLIGLLRDVFDLVVTFFTGGALSAFIGVTALGSLQTTNGETVEHIVRGESPDIPNI